MITAIMQEEEKIKILKGAQAFISTYYAEVIKPDSGDMENRIKQGIRTYLDLQPDLDAETKQKLLPWLFDEMAGYSVLSGYLERDDVEEIDVNAWNDIMVQYVNGKREKAGEHFLSPDIAQDIVKRLLRKSGSVIDATNPLGQGSVNQSTRIAAIMTPVVEEEASVCCSLRILRPAKLTASILKENGSASKEMMTFLMKCFQAGISFVVSGATDAGKTTLLAALLRELPDEMRIFTIETGTREFFLVREEKGEIKNNVVHTLARQEKATEIGGNENISQEMLVVNALRFNPDVIVIGEMRDVEAFAAVEAAGSGHMVVSTIHAADARGAHTRIAMLSKKRYAMDYESAFIQAVTAFPLIVTLKKGSDKKRRIYDISEAWIGEDGKAQYRSLFGYDFEKGFEVRQKPTERIQRMMENEKIG